jgi:hypothetical protein
VVGVVAAAAVCNLWVGVSMQRSTAVCSDCKRQLSATCGGVHVCGRPGGGYGFRVFRIIGHGCIELFFVSVKM